MSKGLAKFIQKHPKYIAEYRRFVVRTVLDNETKRAAAAKA